MKRFFGMLLILSSLSLTAFAAGNSKNVTFTRDVKVGTTQVAAGNYKITWIGNDADIQLSITQNGKTVTTVPAKIEPAKNPFVSMGTETVNGASVLQTIQLEKMNIIIKGAPAAGE